MELCIMLGYASLTQHKNLISELHIKNLIIQERDCFACPLSPALSHKGRGSFIFVLPKPQGHIGVSIKEGERARFIFLAREPDSERRYRPEAPGSAQKAPLHSAQ